MKRVGARYLLVFLAVLPAVLLSAPGILGQAKESGITPKFTGLPEPWKESDANSVELKTGLARKSVASSKSSGRLYKAQFCALSAAVYGASLADMHQTLAVRNSPWWYETDPLARPIVRLPAPAYYATGLAMATGVNWISWRMGHSKRWSKWAAIPQLLTIGGNLYGFKTNRY